jgi:hypothetical protein
MRDGATANSRVLEAELHVNWLLNSSSLFPNSSGRYRIRVHCDDGKVHESKDGVPLLEGQAVSMRYDPKNRSRIEIDLATLKSKQRE